MYIIVQRSIEQMIDIIKMFCDGDIPFRMAGDIENLVLNARAHLEIIMFATPASKNETNSH
jgi:hypothetical protein